MGFHSTFADNTRPGSVASRLRRKRFELLLEVAARFPPPVTVLDIGGTEQYWRMMDLPAHPHLRVTLVNVTPSTPDLAGLEARVGDARDLATFADSSFDIAFSNSVIEHVGGDAEQRKMAAEVRRVGREYYVQTPNRWFPVEPHFQFPLFQFLPLELRAALVRRFALGWYRRVPDPARARELVASIRLLSLRQLSALFPDSTIHRERFWGVTKSLVALSVPIRSG
jgi:hypothetical protein